MKAMIIEMSGNPSRKKFMREIMDGFIETNGSHSCNGCTYWSNCAPISSGLDDLWINQHQC